MSHFLMGVVVPKDEKFVSSLDEFSEDESDIKITCRNCEKELD